MIKLEIDIDNLDRCREGSNVDANSKHSKGHSSSGSFDKLSSIVQWRDTGEEISEDEIPNDLINHPKTIDQLLADMLYDSSLHYSSFPPHNRDAKFELPKYNSNNNFKNELIFISESNSPAHFWFQYKKCLDTWTDSMQLRINKYYTALGKNDLRIHKKSLEIGLIVVAFHSHFKEWYRAKINKFEGRMVQVFLFDYGTHTYLNKDQLKYILDEFLEFPQACHRGRIYGVMPYDGNRSFTIAQMEKFLDEIMNQRFNADLIFYNEEENVYEMKVTFCDDNRDLAEWLIEKKICSRIPENYDILWPYSHNMLETGDYPSLGKILDMDVLKKENKFKFETVLAMN